MSFRSFSLLVSLFACSLLASPRESCGQFDVVEIAVEASPFGQVDAPATSAAPKTTTTSQSTPSDASEADEQTTAEQKKEKQQQEQKRLLKRYEQTRRCVAIREGKEYVPETHKGKALLVLDTIEFGPGVPQGTRYLVGRLHLLNQTDQPATLTRNGIRLKTKDKTIGQSDIPANLAGRSFPVGSNKTQTFGNLKRPDKQTIAPGTAGWTWIFFNQLETGHSLPAATIEVSISGKPETLDLKDQVLGQFGAEIRRIGPEKSLGLFEISGRTNQAAISLLAEELDKMADDKISRVVLAWKKGAQKLDSGLGHHLSQYAHYAGRNSNRQQSSQYPPLPQNMREVHLANMPGSRYSYSGRKTQHDDAQTAVAAAIWTALEALSAEDLVHEIREGHPLIKGAALSAGGARLAPDYLPLVLEQLELKEEPLRQKAAVYALRHFGSPLAIEKLSSLALAKDDEFAALAIASLSQSRYQKARDEISRLLEESDDKQHQRLVRILAKKPSPVWTELYYENAVDPESAVRVESLRALNQLGHEQIIPLLKQCIREEEEELKTAALQLILNRNDPELESILEEMMFEQLAAGSLDSNLQNYLRRTKNTAAVPLLMEQLKKHKKDSSKRNPLIQMLAAIGDDRVVDLFVEIYPELNESEKSMVLTALGHMQSEHFLKFAREALHGKDSSLLYSALNSLSRTDSTEAEQVLIDSFDTMKNKNYYDNLANVIGQIGSAEAEAKLRAGKESDIPEKRQAATNALRNLQRQKPAFQFLSQANYQQRTKNWKQALEYVEMSLTIDSGFAPALAMQGTLKLRLDKTDEAEQSFQKAVKSDPENGEAVVGLSRVLVRKGKPDDAIAAHRKAAGQFDKDMEFDIHSALFYADLVAWGKKQKTPSADLAQKIAHWETEALQYLSDGFRHGYSDRQTIQNAPELEVIAKHADYARALQGSLPERKSDTKSTDSAPDTSKNTGAKKTTSIQVKVRRVPLPLPQPEVIILPAP